MTTRKRPTKRKSPGQERSKETVSAILEATARILARDGYDKTSTNRIAEAAGVSIGSLYQYFPNKDALVGALLENYAKRLMSILETSSVTLADVPLERAAPLLVHAVFDLHRRGSRLHRVLFEQVTNAGNFERRNVLLQRAHDLIVRYFQHHASELRVTDLDAAAFVCTHAIEGIAHAAVLHAPERLEGQALATEAAALLLQYLRKAPGT